MKCTEINELLTEFIMGELPSPTDQAVKEHLKHCQACQREYQYFARIEHQLRRWQAGIEMPRHLAQRWQQALQQQMAADRQRTKEGWLAKKGLALCAAVVLTVAVAWGLGDDDKVFDGTQVTMEQTQRQQTYKITEPTPERTTVEDLPNNADQLDDMAAGPPPAQAESSLKQPAAKQIGRNDSVISQSIPEDSSSAEDMASMEEALPLTMMAASSPAIELAAVEQVKILVDGEKIDVNDPGKWALLIQGINEACPAEIYPRANLPISHTLSITLDNGTVYELYYSKQANLIYGETLFNDQLLTPGPTLHQVLSVDEDQLTN